MFDKLMANPDLDVEYEDDEFDVNELLEYGVAHLDEVCSILAADQENNTCDLQRKLWALHGDASRWVESEDDLEDKISRSTHDLLERLAQIREHIEVVEITLQKMASCCESEESE